MGGPVLDLSIVERAKAEFEAAAFIEEGAALHRQAQSLEVVTPDDTVVAASILKECNNFIKKVEGSRKAITEPLQEFVKSAIGREKELVKPAVESKDIIQKKISVYNQKIEEIRKQEREKLQKEMEEKKAKEDQERQERERQEEEQRKKEEEELANIQADDADAGAKQQAIADERARRDFAADKAKREAEEKQKKDDEEARQRQAVLDANAAAAKPKGMTSYRKYEIQDEKQVPLAYCTPDSVKINAAIKAGVREIPGVRIYEDKIMK